ncbi:MAG: hypothetical protein FWH24_04935 [Oscillospiraceae bacterium]|nr:hypothetical protein [Oscillospiraceae bacterium]
MKNQKLFALLLFTAIVFVLILTACGDTPAEGSGAPAETAPEQEPITEPATPAPTDPPTTAAPTEPPTTTEPFVLDESMEYWDQIKAEMAHYGLTGGIPVFIGDSDEELMKRVGATNTRRTEIDISGDGVPFSFAYSYELSREVENFWDANASVNFARDLPAEQDDLVVGCMWIRGRRTGDSELYMAADEPMYYLAIKTPTDNWGTEGDMTPAGERSASENWEKIFFSGRIMNEETQTSQIVFQIFMGYGFQEIDIGGLVAFKFPSSRDNERAAVNLTAW